MIFQVYRLTTTTGVHYQIPRGQGKQRRHAINIGDIETPTYHAAVQLLKLLVLNGLSRGDRFHAGNHFYHGT